MPAMELVIASCLILITCCLLILTTALVIAALQVRRTAQAVEVKVYEVGKQIDRVREVSAAVGNFAGILGSPWVKGLGLALGAATTYYTVRSRAGAAAGSNGRKGE